MSQTKFLKGECSHCHSRIEFPADSIGMIVDCPHCGKPTELMLAALKQPSAVPTRMIVWTIVAVVILAAGLGGSLIALKRAQKMAARQKQQRAEAAPPETNPPTPLDLATRGGFGVSAIGFEKTPGSTLIYAVGTLNNTTPRQRFGVKVELDLFNAAGQKIGTATDYHQVMEPNSQWQFKALVVDSKAVSARLATIKEDQ